jgi:acyl-CoA hydrolase
MNFMKPIFVGSLVMCEAELTYAGRSSMEVRVLVRSENPMTGDQTFTNSAYVVYVALTEDGQPATVPEIIFENQAEVDRAEAAAERQAHRKQRRQQESL